METPELSAVIEHACSGDSSSLEVLYREFARPVFGLCRHLLGSKEAAEDAVHEVFIKMQRSITTYNGSIPFRNWLFSITSHHCIDVLRKRKWERLWVSEEEMKPEMMPISTASPLAEVIAKDQGTRVREAVARLPEKYRVPLVMQYYSDLSYEEIADQLHLKRNTVATLIFRAKQELRHKLAEKSQEGKR
jgi:RNA polymerase sigma-70 factor (ECF subfamily)